MLHYILGNLAFPIGFCNREVSQGYKEAQADDVNATLPTHTHTYAHKQNAFSTTRIRNIARTGARGCSEVSIKLARQARPGHV